MENTADLNTLSPRVMPPRSWRNPGTHYLQALSHPWYRSLAKLQDSVSVLTTEFWSTRGALNVHLPITTGSISSPMGRGSDSTPVQVDLFGQPTYLADSMQFALEFACRLAPAGAYYLMPSFRGEPADQTHLCQFFHSEAEVPGDLGTVMTVVEDYVRFLSNGLLVRDSEIVLEAAGSVSHLESMLDQPFLSVTFEDAAALLKHQPDTVRTNVDGGVPIRGLTRLGERALLAALGPFVWVTRMDHLSVPFYQAFDPADPAKAMNADLLFGIGETVGAGMRHERAADLQKALDLHAVSAREYAWYLDLREQAPMLTSGFGMGIERFLLWVLNHDDIRDMSALLRFNGMTINP